MPGEFLRGFSKFFTNLSVSQKQELDRAFADIQNSKELTSLDTGLRNLRRTPDQSLPVPELSVQSTARGAQITWNALPDQYINFYEADVSQYSNFSSYTTITTFGTDLILDGLSVTKFVRVRGVRRDGTTSPYSEVLAVVPDAFTIRAHVEEAFYMRVTGFDYNTILGGPGTNLAFTPANSSATSMVWGFLTAYADPACAMFGQSNIQVSVYLTEYTAGYASLVDSNEMWRVSLGEFFNSMSIGPFPINHPEAGNILVLDVRAIDTTTEEDLVTRTRDATIINWVHLNVMEAGS